MSSIQNTAEVAAVAEVAQSDAQTTVAQTSLRVIKAGENFSPSSAYIGDKKCRSTFSFRPHEGGTRYEKTMLFDFSGVSEESLYLLALSSVRITVQHILRNLSPAEMLDSRTLSTVDVQEVVLGKQRPSGNPATVALKALMRMGITEAVAQQLISEAAKAQSGGDATPSDPAEQNSDTDA